ncbi:plasminogen-like [Mercenaria mercenaria]|uniref:plasminogen-like n=1 Tax=Mercenaria mercenaria TaxID=6596 RepID=UPI00234FA359|nr:plasminogen-like [Mercenaria mercenaria]
MAKVSCDYGYQPNLPTINCITSDEWENATCDPKDCGSLSSIADGTVSVPVTTHGATATYTCNFDYALTEGDSTRSCDTGTWTGIEPTCTPIPNRGCYVVGYAYLYQGTRQTTSDGIICQRWDSQSPHGHNRNDPAAFPDISASAAANYCRDPDGTGAPWCYTVDSNIR